MEKVEERKRQQYCQLLHYLVISVCAWVCACVYVRLPFELNMTYSYAWELHLDKYPKRV